MHPFWVRPFCKFVLDRILNINTLREHRYSDVHEKYEIAKQKDVEHVRHVVCVFQCIYHDNTIEKTRQSYERDAS